MKKFLKQICRSKSILNSTLNAHNMSDVRSWAVIQTEGLQWLIMYDIDKIEKH